MKILLISLSLLLLAPNFIHLSLDKKPVYDHKEKFEPSLSYINSIDKLIDVSDSTAYSNHVCEGTLEYAITVANVIRNRFYHGFSEYPLNENWIAAVGERCFGYGLASIVNPDDILKYSYGGCSQQSIVLIEVMKRKHISYRSVGFPHHYASELCFHKNWYFFDPNMEPVISDSQRLENNWKGYADSLKKYYDKSRFPDLDWKFGNNLRVTLGRVNAKTAPKAMVFQTVTHYLSKSIWLLPILIAFRLKKSTKST